MPVGRPSTFTPEIAERICKRIASGETLTRICQDDDMPVRSTVRLWKMADPEFSAKYAQARIDQAEVYFDQVLGISDDALDDPDIDVQAAKLAVDSRKWVLARMDRALYGDRTALDHGGQDGNPVKTQNASLHVEVDALPEADRAALLRILHRDLQGAK